ncbi:hypothetical protein ACFQVC_02035 [Streptomyces monticola]|uniref:Uncharacterized protein n=1 Tax=Streptomyces monticola TaxID=2666263 RepID=A0ABW2JAG0_9ACTN
MSGDIWIGDLLNAFATAAATEEDKRHIARLLGFADTAAARPGAAGRSGERPRHASAPEDESPVDAPDADDTGHAPDTPPTDLTAPTTTAPDTTTDGPQLLTPVAHEPRPPEEWLVDSLAAPGTRRTGAPLPYTPLLAPRSAPAILQLALSQLIPGGDLDVPETVRVIAEGRPLAQLPRRPERTLRFGVEVLVDLGAGMEPFSRDQQELVTQIRQTIGREHTQVRYFEGSPLHGTGSGGRHTWHRYKPPARGTRVLLLSDLGIGGPPLELRRGTPEEWREWTRLLHGAECAAVAFVPYPPKRWPAWARQLMHLVAWDHHTTVGRIGLPAR